MKLRIPTVRAVMDRRILVNFRVDPTTLARIIPEPFRVKRVHCWGVAGVCLIRLRNSRPKGLPAALGQTSENAACRIAVEWDENGATKEGVYIPLRHTNSRLNALAGGRIFPGVHALSQFDIHECGGLYKIKMRTTRGDQDLKLLGRETDAWPKDSIFADPHEASEFFRNGCVGYSQTQDPEKHEGLELHPFDWDATPLHIEHIAARFFNDPETFPPGSCRFDSAMLMRDIDHEWRTLPPLHAAPASQCIRSAQPTCIHMKT